MLIAGSHKLVCFFSFLLVPGTRIRAWSAQLGCSTSHTLGMEPRSPASQAGVVPTEPWSRRVVSPPLLLLSGHFIGLFRKYKPKLKAKVQLGFIGEEQTGKSSACNATQTLLSTGCRSVTGVGAAVGGNNGACTKTISEDLVFDSVNFTGTDSYGINIGNCDNNDLVV